MLKAAERSSNALGLMIFAIESSRMYLEEAKMMYKQVLSKTEDSIMAIGVILQRMRSTDDALRVLKHYIGESVSICCFSIAVYSAIVRNISSTIPVIDALDSRGNISLSRIDSNY